MKFKDFSKESLKEYGMTTGAATPVSQQSSVNKAVPKNNTNTSVPADRQQPTIAKAKELEKDFEYPDEKGHVVKVVSPVGQGKNKDALVVQDQKTKEYFTVDPESDIALPQVQTEGNRKNVKLSSKKRKFNRLLNAELAREYPPLLEINFNKPELIKQALDGPIMCGFEAEVIIPVDHDTRFEYGIPHTELQNSQPYAYSRMINEYYAELEETLQYREAFEELANEWVTDVRSDYVVDFLEQHLSLEEQDAAVKKYNKNIPDDHNKVNSISEISEADLIELVDNDEIGTDWVSAAFSDYMYEELYNDSDVNNEITKDARTHAADYYSIEEWAETQFGSIQEMLEEYDLLPETNGEEVEVFSHWTEKHSQYQEIKVGDYHDYHGDTEQDYWRLETDSSIEADFGEKGQEFISPVYTTPRTMLAEMNSLFSHLTDEGVSTNDSTGFHVTMSLGEKTESRFNPLKVAMLVGDQYLLQQFSRETNTYAASQLAELKSRMSRAIKQGTPESFEQLESLMQRSLRMEKYASIHFKRSRNEYGNHLVEFRIAGGSGYLEDFDKIAKTVVRYSAVMQAGYTDAYRKEYIKAIVRLYNTLFPKEGEFNLSLDDPIGKARSRTLPKDSSIVKMFQRNLNSNFADRAVEHLIVAMNSLEKLGLKLEDSTPEDQKELKITAKQNLSTAIAMLLASNPKLAARDVLTLRKMLVKYGIDRNTLAGSILSMLEDYKYVLDLSDADSQQKLEYTKKLLSVAYGRKEQSQTLEKPNYIRVDAKNKTPVALWLTPRGRARINGFVRHKKANPGSMTDYELEMYDDYFPVSKNLHNVVKGMDYKDINSLDLIANHGIDGLELHRFLSHQAKQDGNGQLATPATINDKEKLKALNFHIISGISNVYGINDLVESVVTEVNFNDPDLVEDSLDAPVQCGFEAEVIFSNEKVYAAMKKLSGETSLTDEEFDDIYNNLDIKSEEVVELMMINDEYGDKLSSLEKDYTTWIKNEHREKYADVVLKKYVVSDTMDWTQLRSFHRHVMDDQYGWDWDNWSSKQQREKIKAAGLWDRYEEWIRQKALQRGMPEYAEYQKLLIQVTKQHHPMADFIEEEFNGLGPALRYYNFDRGDTGSISHSRMQDWVRETVINWAEQNSDFTEVKRSSSYHGNAGDTEQAYWRMEPDSSIRGDDKADFPIEIISPVYDTPREMLSEMVNLFAHLDDRGVYTNKSTGLHVTMSLTSEASDINPLKVVALLGEDYLLKLFNREKNRYAVSQLRRIKNKLSGSDGDQGYRLTFDDLENILGGYVDTFDKFTAVNFKSDLNKTGNQLVEFRIAGGSYLNRIAAIAKSVSRYSTVLQASVQGNDTYDRDYKKAVVKLASKFFGNKQAQVDDRLPEYSKDAAKEFKNNPLVQMFYRAGAQEGLEHLLRALERYTGEVGKKMFEDVSDITRNDMRRALAFFFFELRGAKSPTAKETLLIRKTLKELQLPADEVILELKDIISNYAIRENEVAGTLKTAAKVLGAKIPNIDEPQFIIRGQQKRWPYINRQKAIQSLTSLSVEFGPKDVALIHPGLAKIIFTLKNSGVREDDFWGKHLYHYISEHNLTNDDKVYLALMWKWGSVGCFPLSEAILTGLNNNGVFYHMNGGNVDPDQLDILARTMRFSDMLEGRIPDLAEADQFSIAELNKMLAEKKTLSLPAAKEGKVPRKIAKEGVEKVVENVPNNDKKTNVHRLMQRPLLGTDYRSQMEAYFVVPDPSMIRDFRVAMAGNKDVDLRPIFKAYLDVKLHPADKKKISESRGVTARVPGDEYINSSDPEDVLTMQDVTIVPDNAEAYASREELDAALDVVIPKDATRVNNGQFNAGTKAAIIALVTDKDGNAQYWVKPLKQIPGRGVHGLWPTLNGYKFKAGAEKESLPLKPSDLVTGDQFLTTQQVVTDIENNTEALFAGKDEVLIQVMNDAVTKARANDTSPIPNAAKYLPVLQKYAGEYLGPLALIDGGNLEGDTKKMLEANGLSTLKGSKLLFPTDTSYELIDSVLKAPDGTKIGVSSKISKGGGAASSLSGIAKQITPEMREKYPKGAAIIETLGTKGAVEGPILVARLLRILSIIDVKAFSQISPGETDPRSVKSPKLQKLLKDQYVANLDDPAYRVRYHLLNAIVNAIIVKTNAMPEVTGVLLDALNNNNIIQLLANGTRQGEDASMSYYTKYPAVFTGNPQIHNKSYFATGQKGRLGFKLK